MTKQRKYRITIAALLAVFVITSLYMLACVDANKAPDAQVMVYALGVFGVVVMAFCGGNAAEHLAEAKKALGLDTTKKNE